MAEWVTRSKIVEMHRGDNTAFPILDPCERRNILFYRDDPAYMDYMYRAVYYASHAPGMYYSVVTTDGVVRRTAVETVPLDGTRGYVMFRIEGEQRNTWEYMIEFPRCADDIRGAIDAILDTMTTKDSAQHATWVKKFFMNTAIVLAFRLAPLIPKPSTVEQAPRAPVVEQAPRVRAMGRYPRVGRPSDDNDPRGEFEFDWVGTPYTGLVTQPRRTARGDPVPVIESEPVIESDFI